MGLSIEAVDKLTGPAMGRPKSATFRTCDVVGLDTLVHVANGVKDNCPDDERKAVTEPSEAEPEEASEEEEEEAAASSSSDDEEEADAGPALWQRSPKEVWKELRKHGWKWANGSLEYDYHYVRPGARKGRT